MKSSKRRHYPDEMKYAVYVLYMHGYTYSQICRAWNAKSVDTIETKNVDSILRRSDYYHRKEMSLELRQKHLDLLGSEVELAGIKIADWAFVAQPLDDNRQK